MHIFRGKGLVVFGFILVLLVGIPSTIYLVQQQQDVRSRAEKTSVLSFETAKTTVAVNEEFPVVISIDPGKNFVTYANIEVLYDQTKLAPTDTNNYSPNSAAFPLPVRGPTLTPGKIVFSLQSTSGSITQSVRAKTTVATIRFKAIAPTTGTPAAITFGTGSSAYSGAGPANGGGNDLLDENVLTGQFIPANITITGSATTVEPTAVPTNAPGTSTGTSVSPTAVPVQSVTNPTPTTIANQVPTCISLNSDRATTGVAPYSIALTATGNDADGNIAKVTFQYGDGPVDNITSGGGIGTNSVSSQVTHTYTNPGTYQAYALLSDNQGGISATGSCQQTITVTAAASAAVSSQQSGSTTTTTSTDAQGTSNGVTTTLPKTGPQDLLIGFGAIGGGITLIGLILFFAL